MSQIYKSLTSGPVPPSVATSYVTNSGTAVPAANILNVLATDTTANNTQGIFTTGSGNTVTVDLSNRVRGTATTTDATPATLISFALPAVGSYSFDINVANFNTTLVAGAAYSVFVGARSDGVNAVKFNLEDKIVNEEAADAPCNVQVSVSGNNVILQAVGIAGSTINWNAVGTYVFVGP